MTPFHELSASAARALLDAGEISAEMLVASCLERIRERDDAIGAWEYLDAEQALAAAREKREERAVEKEAENAPLFAALIKEEGYVKPRKKGTGR